VTRNLYGWPSIVRSHSLACILENEFGRECRFLGWRGDY
jgi:hypothetical protein